MSAITGPWQKAQELGLNNIRATADGVVGEIGEYSVGIREAEREARKMEDFCPLCGRNLMANGYGRAWYILQCPSCGWKQPSEKAENTLRRVSPEIERELRDKEGYIRQLEAGLREAAHSDCYGCQGTGLIRWPGIIDGKPCPCLTRRTED